MSASRALAIERQGLAHHAFGALEQRFERLRARAGRKTSTRARDNKAALSSNDGFSVVAPMSVIEPSSITGRKESCCARLKRWISSTNRSVPCPCARRSAGGVEDLLQFRDARMDRRELHERVVAARADQPRDRRLAAARRPPEDHRAERRRRKQARQRSIRPRQMLLARDLGERHRPQPLGERRGRRLRLGIDAVEKAHGALCPARATRCPAQLSPRSASGAL